MIKQETHEQQMSMVVFGIIPHLPNDHYLLFINNPVVIQNPHLTSLSLLLKISNGSCVYPFKAHRTKPTNRSNISTKALRICDVLET